MFDIHIELCTNIQKDPFRMTAHKSFYERGPDEKSGRAQYPQLLVIPKGAFL